MDYDLIVLGGGSGGIATAVRAARLGARVALLEPGMLGGTCVNVGCVPKKALWYAAQLAQAQTLAQAYGFASTPGPLDWRQFQLASRRYVANADASYLYQLEETGVEWIRAAGTLDVIGAVRTSAGAVLHAPHIVLATGGHARRPDVPGADLGLISSDMFDLPAPPRRLVIVGGGYIAVEFTGLMQALGSEVQLLVRDSLLAGFEHELVNALQADLCERGVSVRHKVQVARVERDGSDVIACDTDGRVVGQGDALLWAIGRRPNSTALGLESLGVRCDANGHVLSDAYANTNVPGVYAIGDVSTHRALTPVAIAAGRRLANRLFGDGAMPLDETFVPTVLFAEPPLATVGLTEAQAQQHYGDAAIKVYRASFRPMQSVLAGREDRVRMKLVCSGADERVIGLHVYGVSADEMLQGFAVAMQMGMRKADLANALPIHPTVAEELVLIG